VVGLHWPDTYFVEARAHADPSMTILFFRPFDGTPSTRSTTWWLTTRATGLTPTSYLCVAASLVQPSRNASTRQSVASVITNRLRQQTPLQIDATLCYAKGRLPAGFRQRRQADRLALQHLPRRRFAAPLRS